MQNRLICVRWLTPMCDERMFRHGIATAIFLHAIAGLELHGSTQSSNHVAPNSQTRVEQAEPAIAIRLER